MFNYAQLNHDNVVIGISQLTGEVDADNMILINDLDVKLGSIYDRETGKFTAQVIPEPMPKEPHIDEIQAKILVNTETLISMKEMEV